MEYTVHSLPSSRPRLGLKGMAWLVAGFATACAVAVAAVFALLTATAVILLAIVGSVLAGLTGMALRARRTVRTASAHGRGGSAPLLEAHKVGGSWVAYGWDERVR